MTQSGDWKDAGFVAHYNALYGLSEAEARPYLDRLALNRADSLVDFGCGDGSFLAWAAPLAGRALGVDGSARQAGLAREKLRRLPHVEVVESGFLDCGLAGRTFSKGFSRKALHHLTDPQKLEFLRRVGPFFSPGALFLLEDGIFPFERAQLEAHMPQVMEEGAAYFADAWPAKRDDFLHMMREEFPTGAGFWSAAFEAAGFRVAERWQKNCFLGGLLARKEA
ncbi:MAG: class I SAM-dependent methyltransferase [Elusimicrobia bacterium]|nr:class I SAM-dependent methyltransferase [Elusimicrobiota bacterium]